MVPMQGQMLSIMSAVTELKVSVVAVPKTIDNDIPLMDKTFGFDTTVEEAQRAINSAHLEACSAYHGIGLVKLMGRSSVSIAMHASLSSGQVDVCLIPEVPFALDGEYGVLQHLEHLLKTKGFCVVCVAEAAGQDLLQKSGATDALGNVIFSDIGVHKQQKEGGVHQDQDQYQDLFQVEVEESSSAFDEEFYEVADH